MDKIESEIKRDENTVNDTAENLEIFIKYRYGNKRRSFTKICC